MFMIWIWNVPFSAHFVPSHVLLSVPHSRPHHMSHEMTHPFTHSLSRAHVPFHVLLSDPYSMSPPRSHHKSYRISRTVFHSHVLLIVPHPMSYHMSHEITHPLSLHSCPITIPHSLSHVHVTFSYRTFPCQFPIQWLFFLLLIQMCFILIEHTNDLRSV